MLRSLKASLKSGKKASSSPKEEAQALVNKQAAVSKQQAASKPPTSSPSLKPAVPIINEQNLQHYYAEPLPSFRDVSEQPFAVGLTGRACLRSPGPADSSCHSVHPSQLSGCTTAMLGPGPGITEPWVVSDATATPAASAGATSREAAAVCAEAAPLLLHI